MTWHYITYVHTLKHTHTQVAEDAPKTGTGEASGDWREGSDRSHLNNKNLLSIRTQTHKQMKLPKKLNGWIWLHFGWDFCVGKNPVSRHFGTPAGHPVAEWPCQTIFGRLRSASASLVPGQVRVSKKEASLSCCGSLGLGGLSRDWRLCGACGSRTLW